MGYYLSNAGIFLLHTVIGLYILIVLLRFLLQLVRADFNNPISQFVLIVTSPLVMPLRRVIPGYKGIDFSTLVLLFVLQVAEFWLAGLIVGHTQTLPFMALHAVGALLKLTTWVFIAAIFIQIITSWISPGAYNPISAILYRLTEPLLGPARRLLPPMGGIDLSPLLVLIGLQLVLMLVVTPILDYVRPF